MGVGVEKPTCVHVDKFVGVEVKIRTLLHLSLATTGPRTGLMCQAQNIGIFEWTRARRTDTSSFYNHIDPFKGIHSYNER